MKHFIIFCTILVFVSACSTSSSTNGKPDPVTTPELDITETPTPSPTPDLRIIDVNTGVEILKFCLDETDIKNAGFDWIGPAEYKRLSLRNSTENDYFLDSVQFRNAAEATEFLERTGRIISWSQLFMDEKNDGSASPAVDCEITLFKTATGAKIAAQNYNMAETIKAIWKYYPRKMDLSDVNVIYGEVGRAIVIEFTYRNAVVKIYDHTGNPELTEKFARIVLDKLQTAPLIEAVYSEPNIVSPSSGGTAPLSGSGSTQDRTEGTWLVGSEVAPGKWRAVGGDCYAVTRDNSNDQVDMASGVGSIINVTPNDYSVEFVSYPDTCTWVYLGE